VFFALCGQKEMRMGTQQGGDQTYDMFDKLLGSMHGRPDVAYTKPSTIQAISPLLGCAQTFIVATYREKPGEDGKGGGDTVFLQAVTKEGTVRLALPPAVADAIARQRDALTGKSRSRAARENMKTRMERGEVPGFMKGRKR
jgi:hypothetical protein